MMVKVKSIQLKKKRLKKEFKRRLKNRIIASKVRSLSRAIKKTVANKEEVSEVQKRAFQSSLDKLASTGVVKKKRIARIKSKLMIEANK